MDLSQLQIAKIAIKINQIDLTVRFPCSLSVQLKTQKQQAQSGNLHELINGRCILDQKIEIQTQVVKKNNGEYQPKNIKIALYLTSTSGKIPAGSVAVVFNADFINQSPQQFSSSISKCPDRAANISYSVSSVILKSLGQVTANSLHSIHGSNSSIGLPQDDSSINKSSSRNNLRRSHMQTLNKMKTSFTKLNKNQSSFDSKLKDSRFGYRKHEQKRSDYELSSRRLRNYNVGNDDSFRQNNGKMLMQLEIQNSNLLKQISHLKNQVSLQKVRDYSDENYTMLREQIDLLTQQNQGSKQKLRNKQRKQKQYQLKIRELKQELEKRKQRNNIIQKNKIEGQLLLQGRQNIIKQMQMQLKQYQQQVCDLKLSLNTQQKRIEFKQSALKEQINKLNQKYQQSQSQRQKAMMEMNSMLEQLEGNEKKHQNTLKDKQKHFIQQKNKLNKNIQSLNRTVIQLKEKIEDNDIVNDDWARQKKIAQHKIQQIQEELSETHKQLQNCETLLSREKQYIKSLRNSLESHQKLQIDYKWLKNRYQQSQQALLVSKKSVESLTKQLNISNNKEKSFQSELYALKAEVNSSQSTISILNQKILTLKNEEHTYSRQTQMLQISNLQANNKIQQLNSRLEQLQLSYNTLEIQTEEEIGYILKNKNYIETELEQTKYNLGNNEEILAEYQKKVKQSNQELLELTRKLLETQQVNHKIEQQLSQKQADHQMLTNQIKKLQNKEKINAEKLKSRNQENMELLKKIGELEKQLSFSQQLHEQQTTQQTDQIHKKYSALKTKQSALQQLSEKYMILENKIDTQNHQNNQILNENSKYKKQIEYLNQKLADQKLKYEQIAKNKEVIYEQLQQLQQKLQQYENTIQIQEEKYEKLTEQSDKLNKQYKQNSSEYYSAVQQLLQQMCKSNNNSTQRVTIWFPDESLSTLYIDSLKKRNNINTKYQQQISELSHRVEQLTLQLQRSKQINKQQQQQFDFALKAQTQKIKLIRTQYSEQVQQLYHTIHEKDEQLYQLRSINQQLGLQNQDYRQKLEQQQSNTQQLNFINQSFEQSIKNLQNQLQRYQSDNIIIKSECENQLQNINKQNKIRIQNLNKKLQEYQRTFNKISQQNKNSNQTLQQNMEELNTLDYKLNKKTQQLRQLQTNIEEITEQLRESKQLVASQYSIMQQLQQTVNIRENQINGISQQNQQSYIQCKKYQELLSQELHTNQKIKLELEEIKEDYQNLQNQMRSDSDSQKKNYHGKLQEITVLKEEIIAIKADLQLKIFLLEQSANNNKTLKNANEELSDQQANLKSQIIALNGKIQKLSNDQLQYQQDIQTLTSQFQQSQQQLFSFRQSSQQLQDMLGQSQIVAQSVSFKDKQINRLKQQMLNKQKNQQKIIQQLKNNNQQYKKDIMNQKNKQEELKRKVRELQKQIQNIMYERQTDRQNWQQQQQEERIFINDQLEHFKQQNITLLNQLNFTQELADKQQNTLQTKQKYINQIEQINQVASIKIAEFQQQIKVLKKQWAEQKILYLPIKDQFAALVAQIAKHREYSQLLESKNTKLLEVIQKKDTQNRINASKSNPMGESLREIQTLVLKSKTKIITKLGPESNREQIITEFKTVQQKLQSAIRSYQVMNK